MEEDGVRRKRTFTPAESLHIQLGGHSTAIDLFDQGFTTQQLSGAVMRLDIWGLLANGGQPGTTNTRVADYLLTTILKAAPDATILNASVIALDTETGVAQGNFLWHVAESAANQIQVGLVGLAAFQRAEPGEGRVMPAAVYRNRRHSRWPRSNGGQSRISTNLVGFGLRGRPEF